MPDRFLDLGSLLEGDQDGVGDVLDHRHYANRVKELRRETVLLRACFRGFDLQQQFERVARASGSFRCVE